MDLIQRAQLLQHAADNTDLQKLLVETARRDPVFWLNTFCWTYDPRHRGRLPFHLYPFQEDLVQTLCEKIRNGTDTGIEKSRDMGVSWLTLLVFQWFWCFHPNSDFLVGSRKQEYVDTLGNISTLFEKLRYNLRFQPQWMLPVGFDSKSHSKIMRLINPENGNSITGESSNPDFGRGGRYSAILLDEFPRWPFAEAAWAACSQSSPCRITVGTPYGKSNKFAQLMTGYDVSDRIQHKITVHWTQHPHKDGAWYEKEKARMTEDEIARELDISYDLSVGGVVFKEFKNTLHKIDAPYEFNPLWKTVVSFDFGATCSLLVSQIDEFDCLHVFKEIVLYQNGNTEDLADTCLAFLNTLPIKEKPRYTCDPSGNTGDYLRKEKSTHIQILENRGLSPLLFARASRIQNRREEGIQLIKSLLSKRHQGRERILVYAQDCPTLIEAFQSEYRWKENINGEALEVIDEKHPWEDVMDCLRYQVIEFFSVRDGQRKKPPESPEPVFEI